MLSVLIEEFEMWNQGMEIFLAQCEDVAIRSLPKNVTSLHHIETILHYLGSQSNESDRMGFLRQFSLRGFERLYFCGYPKKNIWL